MQHAQMQAANFNLLKYAQGGGGEGGGEKY
jgi:hypothetical protein